MVTCILVFQCFHLKNVQIKFFAKSEFSFKIGFWYPLPGPLKQSKTLWWNTRARRQAWRASDLVSRYLCWWPLEPLPPQLRLVLRWNQRKVFRSENQVFAIPASKDQVKASLKKEAARRPPRLWHRTTCHFNQLVLALTSSLIEKKNKEINYKKIILPYM